MSETRFTPGPWELLELEQPMDDTLQSSFIIRAVEAPGGVAATIGGIGLEQRHNAHLIAAAPEMGMMLLSIFSHVSHGGPTREEGEALLKKAGLL